MQLNGLIKIILTWDLQPIKIKIMRKMNSYLATGLAEGFEQGTEEEVIAAWQYLHDNKIQNHKKQKS